MTASNPVSVSEPKNETSERPSLVARLATLAAIVLPLLGLVAAAFFLWGRGFSWIDLGLLLEVGEPRTGVERDAECDQQGQGSRV